jgi:hypothetical protein
MATAAELNTNTSGGSTTNTAGTNGDRNFSAIAAAATFDAAVIAVEFSPNDDTLSLDSDTALVEIHQAQACFLRGTLIETSEGPVAIEELRAGMLVQTHDHGLQPLRGLGHSRVAMSPQTAPIRFSQGQFGAEADLWVSPNHRILITGQFAELLFGEDEVLAQAKDLINDASIRPDHSFEWLDYYHLRFDQNEIVNPQGVMGEIYHPGPQAAVGFDAEPQTELLSLFPCMHRDTPYGYGAAARPSLRRYEAQLLKHYFS